MSVTGDSSKLKASASAGDAPAARIGVVGTGFGASIARRIAQGDSARFVQLAGVCDRDQFDRAQQLAQQLGVPAYRELDAMLEDPSVQAVGLYTRLNVMPLH